MKRIKIFVILILAIIINMTMPSVLAEQETATIKYSSHIQDIGWQNYMQNGETSGTTGRALRIEAFKMELSGNVSGGVKYQSYIEGSGWQEWQADNNISGTVGNALRIEAIRISLTGDIADTYEISYRVHLEDHGWTDWVKNGETSGIENSGKRIEAIEVRIDKISKIIYYETHVEDYGWLGAVKDGATSGTVGKAKRVEGFRLKLSDDIDGEVEYQSYIEDSGWEENWIVGNAISGTVGKAKKMEAIRIRLTGNIAKTYDIYYRAHVQDYGWLGWAKNGETAGTIGYDKRIEAIEVRLILKNKGEETGNSSIITNPTVKYTSHVEDIGWQNYQKDGAISGTVGTSKRVEAIKVKTDGDFNGDVKYASYVEGIGWQEYVFNNTTSGTEGLGKRVEAIKIELTGEVSRVYDIYYRVHVQDYGWLGWAKNGEIAGTIGYSFRLESLEIKLVKKGTGEKTGSSYEEKSTSISYQAHIQDIGTSEIKQEGEIVGTVGLGKRLEALNINLDTNLKGSILYQSYVDKTGWESNYKKAGNWSGTLGSGKSINLIKIKLTDALAEKYNVYYRVHSADFGWLGWAKNDEVAGASYYDIQAIEIKLYLKIDSNQNNLDTNNHYIETGFYSENYNGTTYTRYKDKEGKEATGWINIMGIKYFFNSLGYMIGKDVRKVIDVSSYQNTIDWATVARNKDIDGVILRVAAGAEYEDSKLAENVAALKKYGIPYGLYIYSYAENYDEGVIYGNFVVDRIRKYSMNPTIGIYFDIEGNNYTNHLSVAEHKNIINGFMSVMNANGLGSLAKVYTYKNYAENNLKDTEIWSQIAWIAQYNHFCTYKGSYIGWQYSSSEQVSGINGNVDASVWFSKF